MDVVGGFDARCCVFSAFVPRSCFVVLMFPNDSPDPLRKTSMLHIVQEGSGGYVDGRWLVAKIVMESCVCVSLVGGCLDHCHIPN